MAQFSTEPRFIAFALETFGYDSSFSQSSQQDEFLLLNESLLLTNLTQPAREMIHGWYGSSATTTDDLSGATLTNQDTEWMPSAWTSPFNGEDSVALYQSVVQPYCRTCHLSFPLAFASPADFVGFGTYLQTLVCGNPTQMPQAQVTQANFFADVDAKITFVDEMTVAHPTTWTAVECPSY
jgi:hypothetical protein